MLCSCTVHLSGQGKNFNHSSRITNLTFAIIHMFCLSKTTFLIEILDSFPYFRMSSDNLSKLSWFAWQKRNGVTFDDVITFANTPGTILEATYVLLTYL